MKYIQLSIIIFIFLISQLSYTQEKLYDSISRLNFQELADHFYANIEIKEKAIIYAKEYLQRAKRNDDIIRIADGYFFMSYGLEATDNSISLQYADSIILHSKKKGLQNELYPFLGYYTKANTLFLQRKLKQSLDDYIEAFKLAQLTEDSIKKFEVEYRIADLKNRLGHHKEALEIFKRYLDFSIKNEYPEKNNPRYLGLLFLISDAYRRNNKIDSSTYFNKIGFKKAILAKDTLLCNYFSFNEGINEFYKTNYKTSIDSIKKSLATLKEQQDKIYLSQAYFYLGKSHLALKNKDSSLFYLKKIDTIFLTKGGIHPDLRETYEILINHYKKADDPENQLLYNEQLLKVDSVLNDNYKYLYDKINKEYDTPILLAEKNVLINQLKTKDKPIIYGLIIILIVFAYITILYVRRNKNYKKKFDALMRELNATNVSEKNSTNKIKNIGVPEEILQEILKGLEHFEQNQIYTDQNITLHSLAKMIGSNSAYVSKVINNVKQKNFASYLNDLRITFATKKLQSDTTFRKFTIKAIALDAGFKSAESFSKLFYKKNNIYPSFYIKQLRKGNH